MSHINDILTNNFILNTTGIHYSCALVLVNSKTPSKFTDARVVLAFSFVLL